MVEAESSRDTLNRLQARSKPHQLLIHMNLRPRLRCTVDRHMAGDSWQRCNPILTTKVLTLQRATKTLRLQAQSKPHQLLIYMNLRPRWRCTVDRHMAGSSWQRCTPILTTQVLTLQSRGTSANMIYQNCVITWRKISSCNEGVNIVKTWTLSEKRFSDLWKSWPLQKYCTCPKHFCATNLQEHICACTNLCHHNVRSIYGLI